MLTPFDDIGCVSKPLPLASNAERCSNCFAYLNPFCASRNRMWRCSICGQRNTFPRAMLSSYGGRLARKPTELSEVVMEYALPVMSKGFGAATSSEAEDVTPVPADDWSPATLCVIDVRGGGAAPHAAGDAFSQDATALPACARVGLVTVSSTSLGVFDLATNLSKTRAAWP